MKLFAGSVIVCALLVGNARAQGYYSQLSGANETPPNASTAMGNATFVLNANNTLTYSVTTTVVGATAAHIHSGAAGVAGPILFPLSGGSTTWAGTTPVLTLPQLTALNSLGLYVNVHSSAFPGGEIRDQLRPLVLFSGNGHIPKGAAALSIGPGGGLVVSNIGSSGQDGVEMAMGLLGQGQDGPWSSLQTTQEFDPATMPVGALVTQNVIGGSGQVLSTGCVQANSAGGFTALIDFTPAGSPTYTCNVYDGTTLVATHSGLHSGDVNVGPFAAKYKLECETSLETECCPVKVTLTLTWKIVKVPKTPVDVAGLVVQGNLIEFVPDNDPGNLDISAVRLTGQGVSSFTIDSEAVGALGHLNQGLGNVLLLPPTPAQTGHNGILVANIGSSGQDGVECVLGKADSCDIGLGAIDPGAPIGASLHAHATGTLDGVADQPLGDLTITKAASFFDVFADFSDIGSPTQTLQVFNSGSLVVNLPGHSGPVGSMSAWPKSLGKLGGILECFIVHDPPGTIFALSGQNYVGDELRVLAEGAFSAIDNKSGFSITASGMQTMLVNSEVSPASPYTDIGFALAGVNGKPHLVGTGTLAGGTLNGLTLAHGAPTSLCLMLVSLSSTPVPFKGGTLAAFPLVLQIALPLSPAGGISLPFAMPAGLSGVAFFVQCAIADAAAVKGVSLSNCVRADVP